MDWKYLKKSKEIPSGEIAYPPDEADLEHFNAPDGVSLSWPWVREFLQKPSIFATFSLPYGVRHDPIREEQSSVFALTRARKSLGNDLRAVGVWGIGEETKKVHCHLILSTKKQEIAHKILEEEWVKTVERFYRKGVRKKEIYWSDTLKNFKKAYTYSLKHNPDLIYMYGKKT